MGLKRRPCAWGVVLALGIFTTIAPSGTASAAVPPVFWGVVSQVTPTPEQFQRLKAGGVDSIRVPIAWNAVQPAEAGPFDWSSTDSLVRGAAQAGIEVLPYVFGAPSWAVAADSHYGSPMTLPVKTERQRAAWSFFLSQATLRYGAGGTFWIENPELPVRAVRTWQIWNEENFEYFVARPKPSDYGKLVNLSFSAIRSVDPGAQLILGGMFARPKEAEYKRKPKLAYFATEFLRQMYRTTPGIKSKFVGIALHPYTRTYRYLAPEIEEVREVLKASNDSRKSLWITELGWSSRPPTPSNLFAKGVQGQARELRNAFKVLVKNQRNWRLQRVYWFSVDDQEATCNFCNGSGLFSSPFTPKPSWYSYVRFAGGRP